MTPQRRHRHDGGRRRRRVRLAAIVLVLVLIAAAIVAVSLASSRGAHGSAAATRTTKRPRVATSAPPRLSPVGLPLATPALALTGIASPQEDPLHVPFHTPPRAGLLFNLDSGQVLWQLNPRRHLRIASLTKMMTALLTVEAAPPGALVDVTRQAVDANGSKVGVLPLGRHVRLESMLYGLLLPSGNDASVALAQHIAGSVSAFVAQMNAKAAALGLGCTRYSSPSGYFDAGNYSCAADLAVLAHVDLSEPRIARVTRTSTAALPFPIKGGKLYLANNNPLLIYGYPGTTGLKTGWTAAAGRCLVATATRHGLRLGVVLLDSPDPATQARHLLNDGFERVYHQGPRAEQPIPAGA